MELSLTIFFTKPYIHSVLSQCFSAQAQLGTNTNTVQSLMQNKKLMMDRKHNNISVFPVSYKACSVTSRQPVGVNCPVSESVIHKTSRSVACVASTSNPHRWNKDPLSFGPLTAPHGQARVLSGSSSEPPRGYWTSKLTNRSGPDKQTAHKVL